jgi:Protein of unknown function (DUF3137)
MIELTAGCFQDICAAPPVREQIGSLDSNRRAAVRKFWLYTLGGLILAPLAFSTLFSAGWPTAAFFIAAILGFGGLIVGYSALARVGESLKLPVLKAIAAQAGMDYYASDFSPPVYPVARKTLFGSWLSSESFTDLFNGTDEQGRGYAVYEACLTRKAGKNSQTVFKGQIYALQRRPGRQGTTVIVPDRGLLNFFKPASGMERVELDNDEGFEKKFEIYSTAPMEARQLVADPMFRRRLLDMRSKSGRVLAYFDAENALLAAWGKNRFEPGSMFRSRGGEERVKAMLDDVCDALALLRELKARLG